MDILLLILIFVVFRYLSFFKEGEFHQDYLGKRTTTAVNGLFVILVVFSHGVQYFSMNGTYDHVYAALRGHLSQMIVATFLFYSGYGMMESVKRKGYPYVRSVMTSRFWKLFFQFNVAVFLYLVLAYARGTIYSPSRILLSMIGWATVGNSNWYIFAIYGLYIAFFLSFFLLKWKNSTQVLYVGSVLLTILSMLFVLWQIRMGRPDYCYNTIILFSGGVWWSLLKPWIDRIVMKNEMVYFAVVAMSAAVYCAAYIKRLAYGVEGYTVWAAAFMVLVLLITMKVSLDNPVLTWFGNHVFSVYILQRIPMSILQSVGFNQSHKYMFLILSLLGTIFLALVFEKVTGKIIDMWCQAIGRIRKKTVAA